MTGRKDREFAWEIKRLATVRSTILEIKVRFDIGRYELRFRGSSCGFFRRGETSECFSVDGNSPVLREMLRSFVMVGIK